MKTKKTLGQVLHEAATTIVAGYATRWSALSDINRTRYEKIARIIEKAVLKEAKTKR